MAVKSENNGKDKGFPKPDLGNYYNTSQLRTDLWNRLKYAVRRLDESRQVPDQAEKRLRVRLSVGPEGDLYRGTIPDTCHAEAPATRFQARRRMAHRLRIIQQ